MHAILKQIAQQLRGYSNSSDDEAQFLLEIVLDRRLIRIGIQYRNGEKDIWVIKV